MCRHFGGVCHNKRAIAPCSRPAMRSWLVMLSPASKTNGPTKRADIVIQALQELRRLGDETRGRALLTGSTILEAEFANNNDPERDSRTGGGRTRSGEAR